MPEAVPRGSNIERLRGLKFLPLLEDNSLPEGFPSLSPLGVGRGGLVHFRGLVNPEFEPRLSMLATSLLVSPDSVSVKRIVRNHEQEGLWLVDHVVNEL